MEFKKKKPEEKMAMPLNKEKAVASKKGYVNKIKMAAT